MASLVNMRPPTTGHGLSSPGATSSSSPGGSSVGAVDYQDVTLGSHGNLVSPGAMSTRDIDSNGVLMALNGGNSGASSLVMNDDDSSLMVISQSMDSINAIGTNGCSDGVRTLFVSGLPLDTKARELYLLFRGYKGYLSSTLKPAGKNGKLTAPVGFVTFETRELAETAMADLKGVKFDPEGTQHLRLEFARSNTKVTRPKNPLSGVNSPLNPLGLAGVLAANGMCAAMPVVSNAGTGSPFGAQVSLSAAHQQAINLANLQAAIGGNSNAVIPQIFQPLTAFDPALLAAHEHATGGGAGAWGAAGNSMHPSQQTGFDSASAALLSQVGLLAPVTGSPNSAASVASLTQQAALIQQANNFRALAAAQLSGQQHAVLAATAMSNSQHHSPVNNGSLGGAVSSGNGKLNDDSSVHSGTFGF